MIRCRLSERLEPMVAVEVLNADGDSRTVEAVLDTGFVRNHPQNRRQPLGVAAAPPFT